MTDPFRTRLDQHWADLADTKEKLDMLFAGIGNQEPEIRDPAMTSDIEYFRELARRWENGEDNLQLRFSNCLELSEQGFRQLGNFVYQGDNAYFAATDIESLFITAGALSFLLKERYRHSCVEDGKFMDTPTHLIPDPRELKIER